MSGISLVFHKKVLLGRVDVTNLYASCADDCCEVIVWTAGIRNYAKAVIRNIDRQNVIAHCIYRHEKWFRPGDYTKDLAMLGRCGPSVMAGHREVKRSRNGDFLFGGEACTRQKRTFSEKALPPQLI